MLHGFGLSVEYNRLVRVEAQIESSVLKRMEESNGLFLPPDIVKGRHVFSPLTTWILRKSRMTAATPCMEQRWQFIRKVM